MNGTGLDPANGKYPFNKYNGFGAKRAFEAEQNDNEIQEIILMPLMKLDPVPENHKKQEEQPT